MNGNRQEWKKSRPGKKNLSSGDEGTQKIHFTQIDILKGLAIISVILMHTYSEKLLTAYGAPFYLFQAVPVFLLLAAFNNAQSLSLLKMRTLAQCYDIAIILRRMKRLMVSYTVIWIIQLVLVFWVLASMIDLKVQNPNHFFYSGIDTVIFNFLCGANGPGNYFIPLIVQFIILVPLFYYLALRSPNQMLVIAFVLDLVMEYLSVLSAMPSWLYGVMVTRYVFMAGLGVWLVFQERVLTPWIVIGAVASAAYIAAVSYFQFQFWIFSLDPAFYHAFAFFWTLLIVVLGFQYLPSAPSSFVVRAVSELGKASWHIFLVQMTWFFFLGFAYPPLDQSIGAAVILALMYLVPCLSIGYGFYRLQNYIMKPQKNLAR
jgi:peptidoglycan/LPS O-acetylase OafA/YrhL